MPVLTWGTQQGTDDLDWVRLGDVGDEVAMARGGAPVDTLTEVFRAAPHGLTSLTRGRLRPDHEHERIDTLIPRFCVADR